MPHQEQINNTPQSATERDHQNIEEQLRAKIYSTFDKFTNSNDRVDDIFKTLGNIIDQLENSEEIKNKLDTLRQVEEKEEFCQRLFALLKQLVDWRESHLVEFEHIRRRDFNEQGSFIELNKMLSYGIHGDTVHLHVPPNVSTPNSEKLRLIQDGLRELAQIVGQDPNIRFVTATSWIVAAHPQLLKKFHFTVEGEIDEETRTKYFSLEHRPVANAVLSREDLIKYYS